MLTGLIMQERLQKIIANKGLCSRREAERWILEGRVKVDGQLASIGQKVDMEKQDVVVNGKSINRLSPEKIVIAVHKPRGFTCTNDDPYAEKLVFELLPKHHQRLKLFVAGRLDKDSSGLVIITNDGSFAQKLTHPSHEIEKRYRVRIKPGLERKDVSWFLQGQIDEGETLQFDRIDFPTKGAEPYEELDVILSHGKKREIRRLFKKSRRDVKRLKRLSIGRLNLKGLTIGACKELTPKEIESLLAAPGERR